MGNKTSSQEELYEAVAFSLAPLDPLPIVDIRFCYMHPISIVIPTIVYTTHIDCVLRTQQGNAVFYWDGRNTKLMDHPSEPTVVTQMKRKTNANINTHEVFLESMYTPKHRIMRIRVDFPELYNPKVISTLETTDGERISIHVSGEWSHRKALLTMCRGEGQAHVVVARIRSVQNDKLFGEYVVDIVPGVDAAAIVIVCTAIDRMASVLRGLIY
ncbi:hypothetical protein THRCLA_01296 [Thraustotheca clavata]|uniref:Tubby C-terminal domain-containing protein n=1 Tax=Thraustotheca clavata TaxID=74557 RepID=A0A1W0A9J0_9STRA|nr:hypothetical protein THRCLA_01296 [Thraustotheca clavata]